MSEPAAVHVTEPNIEIRAADCNERVSGRCSERRHGDAVDRRIAHCECGIHSKRIGIPNVHGAVLPSADEHAGVDRIPRHAVDAGAAHSATAQATHTGTAQRV